MQSQLGSELQFCCVSSLQPQRKLVIQLSFAFLYFSPIVSENEQVIQDSNFLHKSHLYFFQKEICNKSSAYLLFLLPLPLHAIFVPAANL